MTDTGPPPPDTTEMLAVHQIFRRALGDAPQLVASVAPGDTSRSGLVGDYFQEVFIILHLHHEGEDEVIWPRLYERAGAKAALIRNNEHQHQEILDPLARAEQALAAWVASPDDTTSAGFLAAVGSLSSTLFNHFRNEEEHILPIIAEHITIQEWGELPGHAMRKYPGDRVWIPLGLVRENMTQAQRDMMLAHMPPPAVEMWTTKGEAAYNDFIGAVRGG